MVRTIEVQSSMIHAGVLDFSQDSLPPSSRASAHRIDMSSPVRAPLEPLDIESNNLDPNTPPHPSVGILDRTSSKHGLLRKRTSSRINNSSKGKQSAGTVREGTTATQTLVEAIESSIELEPTVTRPQAALACGAACLGYFLLVLLAIGRNAKASAYDGNAQLSTFIAGVFSALAMLNFLALCFAAEVGAPQQVPLMAGTIAALAGCTYGLEAAGYNCVAENAFGRQANLLQVAEWAVSVPLLVLLLGHAWRVRARLLLRGGALALAQMALGVGGMLAQGRAPALALYVASSALFAAFLAGVGLLTLRFPHLVQLSRRGLTRALGATVLLLWGAIPAVVLLGTWGGLGYAAERAALAVLDLMSKGSAIMLVSLYNLNPAVQRHLSSRHAIHNMGAKKSEKWDGALTADVRALQSPARTPKQVWLRSLFHEVRTPLENLKQRLDLSTAGAQYLPGFDGEDFSPLLEPVVSAAEGLGRELDALLGQARYEGLGPRALDRELAAAARAGDARKAALLLRLGANPNARDAEGPSAAAGGGGAGGKEEEGGRGGGGGGGGGRASAVAEGYTPLLWAAHHGHRAVAEALVRGGADLRARDAGGLSALHLAAWRGHAGMVRFLLEHGKEDLECGCTPAAQRGGGWGRKSVTPLYLARLNEQSEVVELLRAAGATVEDAARGPPAPAAATLC